MMKMKSLNYKNRITRIRIFVSEILIILFCCCLVSNIQGQNNDCKTFDDFEKIIVFTDSKNHIAHLHYKICYSESKKLTITLDHSYSTNGEKLTGNKLKRQGYQLFLDSIEYDAQDIFLDLQQDFLPHNELKDSIQIFFVALDSAYWTDRSIIFSLSFTFNVDNKLAKKEKISFDFKLPDNRDTTLVDNVKTESINNADLDGDIQLAEVDKNAKKTNIQKVERTRNEYLDSIKFYYNELLSLYMKITNSQISQEAKPIMAYSFTINDEKFKFFVDSCRDLSKESYVEQYELIRDKLIEELILDSTDLNIKNSELTEDTKSKSSVGINLNKMLMIILPVILVVFIVLYILKKIKRKIKK